MDDKRTEVYQLRMSKAERNRLRLIANDEHKPESQVLRDLIDNAAERTMFHIAIKTSIPGACSHLKLPPAMQTMSYDDIVAALDEKQAGEFATFVMDRTEALVKEYRRILGYRYKPNIFVE